MEITPIAYFRSPFRSKFGIPRQSGLVDDLLGEVCFVSPWDDADAVRGLSDFSHLWLIWGFSENVSAEKHSTVRPPRLGGNQRMGVFATRSPFRPNNLGLSCVQIERVEQGRIVVRGADLMDGTPIFDVKPYLPSADAYPNAKGGFTDARQWKSLTVEMPDDVRSKLGDDAEAVVKTLSLDPRPHYHSDPERIYGMPFGEWDIRFQVKDGVLRVIGVER